jgi:MFS family permease
LSAALVRAGVPYRPAPQHPDARRPFWSSSIRGAKLINSTVGLRPLFVLAMLAGLYIAPEGLAVAWVAELGEPTKTVGLVMGAPAAGLIIGAWLLTRFVSPERRPQLTGPLAVLTGLALTLTAFHPNLPATLAVLVFSGIFAAFQVQVGASFGRLTPADGRAQVMGLLGSGALTAQGIGVLLAGVLAELIGVAQTVAALGAVGALAALPAAVAATRATALQKITG